MIRVLHVLSELRSSGAEVALQAAGGMWEHSGIRCDVLATGHNVGPFAGTLEAAGYRIHHVPFSGDFHFLRRYASLLRQERYDVVHIHMERASFYTSLVAILAKARCVRTVRSSFFFTGNLRQRRRLQRRISRALGTRFVAISPSVAQTEWEFFRNQTVHIDNWIDVSRFRAASVAERQRARDNFDVPDDAFVVTTVGNCSATKNHAALLEALARLDCYRWVWIHVGEEDDASSEQLLARRLGVSSSCRFLGRSDPLSALHAADLYAMPSLHEGLGMATVEALSTGLPALLTDVPGNRDLADLSSAIVWSASDVSSLSKGLDGALSVVARAKSSDVSEAQRAAVAARFSPERGVCDYAALYRDVL